LPGGPLGVPDACAVNHRHDDVVHRPSDVVHLPREHSKQLRRRKELQSRGFGPEGGLPVKQEGGAVESVACGLDALGELRVVLVGVLLDCRARQLSHQFRIAVHRARV